MKLIFLILILSLGFKSLAQEKAPLSNESEAAVVKVGGNTESESYSAKEKTTYTKDADVWVSTGRYLQSKASGSEIAKSWEAALRYEKVFSDQWSVFIQQGAESNIYAGYLQRDNTDVGGKYTFIKSDSENALLEAGLRSTRTLSSQGADPKRENFGRLYTEYSRQINPSLSAKAWVEYLPNFSDQEGYFLNYEPSVTVLMSQVFSLKVAYLVKIHNKVLLASERKDDTAFTTSLVAKF